MASAVTYQSPSSIDVEDEFLLRLFLLIKKVGTNVCHQIFHQYFPQDKNQLYQSLIPYKKILKPLLFPDQYEVLFENSNDEVDSSQFDITLFMLLLRKCCPALQPPKKGWNKRPSITDLSEGANLERLRRKRNSLAHAGYSNLTINEFNKKWQSCSNLLVTLGADVNEINSYATIQLDASNRSNIQEDISILHDRLYEHMDASLVNYTRNEEKIKKLQDEIQMLREMHSFKSTDRCNSNVDDEFASRLKNHYLRTENIISCLEWDNTRQGFFKLDDLYIETKLCYWNERNSLREYDQGDAFYPTIKKLHDEMAARINICILSDPGKGKTVLLQKISLDYAKDSKLFKENFPNIKFLLLIRCKDLIRHGSLVNYITETFFKEIDTRKQMSFLETLSSQSTKILFLIDGYEEMQTCPDMLMNVDVVRELDSLIGGNLYHGANVITTTRPLGISSFQKQLRLFRTKYIIPSLDSDQIMEYISKYFSEKQQDFCSQLFRQIHENEAVKELSTSALTLSIICNIYEHSENIPTNMSDLYHELIKHMIEQFKVTHGFSKQYNNQKRRVSELLFNGIGQIALESLKSGKDYFEQHELAKHFSAEEKSGNSLFEKIGARKKAIEQINSTTILQLGFLRADNGNNPRKFTWYYHFEPKPCQKYLAAEFVARNILKNGVKKGFKKLFAGKENLLNISADILRRDHELCLFIVDSLGRRGEKEICKHMFNELFCEFGNILVK